MVSARRADTKDTLPADTIDVFCSSAMISFGFVSWSGSVYVTGANGAP
jgi:hypothetical protein